MRNVLSFVFAVALVVSGVVAQGHGARGANGGRHAEAHAYGNRTPAQAYNAHRTYSGTAHPTFYGSYGHLYRLRGGNYHRFWFNGFYFSVIPAEYALCDGWLWDRDIIEVFVDNDHPEWYYVYNVRLHRRVHVTYVPIVIL